MRPALIATCASLCLLSIAAVNAAKLYKVVNPDGTITYTDQPVPGAEPVDLAGVNSAVVPSMRPATPPVSKKKERKTPEYKLGIVSPADGETIRNNLGELTIVARMEPQTGGTYQLLMNGVPYASQDNPVFALEGVNRGEYQYQVQFLNNSGKVLASSEQRVLYLHQSSALINPN